MLNTTRNYKSNGFTLIELSIVLVVIGLVVGGVLFGADLIKAAQTRAVIKEYQAYRTSMNTFRDKYRAIPGDMANATEYWGAAHADPATCTTTVGTGQTTCNGNGDGRVGEYQWSMPQNYESFRFWQHLANAGLVGGTYTGIAGPLLSVDGIIGQNIPASQYTGAGWMIYYTLNNWMLMGSEYFPEDIYANSILYFGGAGRPALPNYPTELPILSAIDAYNIDLKIDDGKPGGGQVLGPSTGSPLSPNCVTTNSAATAAYNLTYSGRACNLLFKTDY